MRTYSSTQSWLLLSLASLLFVASLLITLSETLSPGDILQRKPSSIEIELVGHIPNPGIYSFPREPTVEQALLKAGGIERRKISNIHILNNTLGAGSKIVAVRNAKNMLTIELARMEPEKCIVFSIRLNLNEVEERHLTLIPGIGPRLAQRIIHYRSKNAGFRNMEELMEVRGIGEKKLQTLKGYLTIPGE